MALVLLVLYFAYLMDMPTRGLVFLLLFCGEVLLLKASFDSESVKKFRVAVLALLTLSTLFYVMTSHVGQPGWDAKHLFLDARAVRHNQSPYTGPGASGMNQNFVPIFAVCAALGDSLEEFRRNLLFTNAGSTLACGLMLAGGLVWYLRKAKLGASKGIEVSLEAVLLAGLFYSFFEWNMVVGNISAWVAPLVLLLMGAHYLERPVITGVILGLAITVKPFLLTLAVGYGLYVIIKKDGRSLVVLISAFLLFVATALLLQLFEGGLGFDTYIEFFTYVIPKKSSGMLVNLYNYSAAAMLSSILKNLGVGIDAHLMVRFCLALSLLAFGAGVYLTKKDPRKRMPMELVVYYLLLSTAIYPLVWVHYLSWLVGPAIYIACKLNSDRQSEHLVPAFLLCCLVLMFSSIAWMGTLALPVLFLAYTLWTQEKTG
jgi:hypothetical protein